MKKKLTPEVGIVVQQFSRLAQKFCKLIRSSEESEPNRSLTAVASVLGELYGIALLLPDVAPTTVGIRLSKTKLARRTKEYRVLNERLAAKLGTANRYWKVFDPPNKKSLVSTTLSDDLADICLDLERGLALQVARLSRNDFLWQWRFDFRNHWGRHAVSALAAIHHAVAWDYE